MNSFDNDIAGAAEYAYYFSDWIWSGGSTDFMKSMLLFFDGLALALPPELATELIERDPILATPLAEKGLLVNFDPTVQLDAVTADRLANTLTELLERCPELWSREPFSDLLGPHWGHVNHGASGAVTAFERALDERGLITPALRAGFVRMAEPMRLLVLTVFAQTLRVHLGNRGVILHPATDSPWEISGLGDVLDSYREVGLGGGRMRDVVSTASHHYNFHYGLWHSAGRIADDLHSVGADLSPVPLDEVLDFRRQYGKHYRAYMKALREFLISQTYMSPAELERVFQEREQEISDYAAEVRRVSRAAFGLRTVVLGVSLAGAVWTMKSGDPIGALLAAAAAGAQAVPVPAQNVTAYSYLICAARLS